MFYRRKIILALLQTFNGELEKISLQKLLFLFTVKQQKAEYDFIPYKFGCYSFSANADLFTMAKKGQLAETENSYICLEKTNYKNTLKDSDKKILQQIKILYGKYSKDQLVKHTYTNFPYWAINSTIVNTVLNTTELQKVNQYKSTAQNTTLFTIGYEGISLEEYLNRLIKNGVQLLVDVRNNPLSMKYGFSKSQLKKYCESVNIQYIHLPEVGIQSEQRQELNTQADYDKLFKTYMQNNLTKTQATQQQILSLLIQHKRIALTCFEANICQCHRKHLAEAITSLPNFNYVVKHI